MNFLNGLNVQQQLGVVCFRSEAFIQKIDEISLSVKFIEATDLG